MKLGVCSAFLYYSARFKYRKFEDVGELLNKGQFFYRGGGRGGAPFLHPQIQTQSETCNALKLLGEREWGYGS